MYTCLGMWRCECQMYCWGQYPWVFFASLAVTVDSTESFLTPFAKTPFSWFHISFGLWVAEGIFVFFFGDFAGFSVWRCSGTCKGIKPFLRHVSAACACPKLGNRQNTVREYCCGRENSLSFWVNSVNFVKNLVSSLFHTNSRLRGTH